MRERVLGVQAGMNSITNEVVVLVMAGGAGSTSARVLRRRLVVVAGDDVDGFALIVFRFAGKTYVCTPVTASASLSSRRERWGWRRAGLRRGESGEGERGEWQRRWGECAHCGSV
jgi:hypothetical protein